MPPSRASPPSMALLWRNVVRIFPIISVCERKPNTYIYLSLRTLSNKMEEQKRERERERDLQCEKIRVFLKSSLRLGGCGLGCCTSFHRYQQPLYGNRPEKRS